MWTTRDLIYEPKGIFQQLDISRWKNIERGVVRGYPDSEQRFHGEKRLHMLFLLFIISGGFSDMFVLFWDGICCNFLIQHFLSFHNKSDNICFAVDCCHAYVQKVLLKSLLVIAAFSAALLMQP